MAGSITDWDSQVGFYFPFLLSSLVLTTDLRTLRFVVEQTVIGQKARGPTVTKSESALNAARRSGAAIDTDKKSELPFPFGSLWDLFA